MVAVEPGLLATA